MGSEMCIRDSHHTESEGSAAQGTRVSHIATVSVGTPRDWSNYVHTRSGIQQQAVSLAGMLESPRTVYHSHSAPSGSFTQTLSWRA